MNLLCQVAACRNTIPDKNGPPLNPCEPMALVAIVFWFVRHAGGYLALARLSTVDQ